VSRCFAITNYRREILPRSSLPPLDRILPTNALHNPRLIQLRMLAPDMHAQIIESRPYMPRSRTPALGNWTHEHDFRTARWDGAVCALAVPFHVAAAGETAGAVVRAGGERAVEGADVFEGVGSVSGVREQVVGDGSLGNGAVGDGLSGLGPSGVEGVNDGDGRTWPLMGSEEARCRGRRIG